MHDRSDKTCQKEICVAPCSLHTLHGVGESVFLPEVLPHDHRFDFGGGSAPDNRTEIERHHLRKVE